MPETRGRSVEKSLIGQTREAHCVRTLINPSAAGLKNPTLRVRFANWIFDEIIIKSIQIWLTKIGFTETRSSSRLSRITIFNAPRWNTIGFD